VRMVRISESLSGDRFWPGMPMADKVLFERRCFWKVVRRDVRAFGIWKSGMSIDGNGDIELCPSTVSGRLAAPQKECELPADSIRYSARGQNGLRLQDCVW